MGESRRTGNPEQEERKPEPGHVPVRGLNANDGEVGSHLRASRARIASVGGDLAGFETGEDLRARGRWVGFNEMELGGDAVEAGLDGRIADAESLLHLLDGAVRAEKGDDKDLVFEAEAREFGEGKLALDGDSLLRDADALDDERGSLGDAEKFLPVGSGFGGLIHAGVFSFLKYENNNN